MCCWSKTSRSSPSPCRPCSRRAATASSSAPPRRERSRSRCARELRPDVVILDVRLAELDGISAAVEIRRVAPDTRIVIYSGDEASLQQANDAGFPDTLLKGAIADDLIELVDG